MRAAASMVRIGMVPMTRLDSEAVSSETPLFSKRK